ncbi:hypothetical protein F5Y10DRAFT_218497 [Nemania abortiva]|nr:hypothetical protein F5Y10DRAFT_218497 [Nemania abortiva]
MLPNSVLSHPSENVGLLTASGNVDSDEKDLKRPGRCRLTPVLISVLIVSLFANTVQLWAWAHERALAASCASPISGLRPSKPVIFTDKTPWGDTSNMTALDELWYTMDVNPGVIQLPKQSHLGSTQDFPWDETKGLYIINSYHSLHCLKIIYTYVRELQRDYPQRYTIDHVVHCLGSIRSDVMCEADDTLFPYEVEQPTKMPLKRMCRSWDQLEEFAMRNSACFQRRQDSDPLHDTLFEYMNCPPSSPYYTVVEELKMKTGATEVELSTGGEVAPRIPGA